MTKPLILYKLLKWHYQDCMELLLPMAAKKLDLSFNIEPNVPPWVYADYARIRQGWFEIHSFCKGQFLTLWSPDEFDRQRCQIYSARLRTGHLFSGNFCHTCSRWSDSEIHDSVRMSNNFLRLLCLHSTEILGLGSRRATLNCFLFHFSKLTILRLDVLGVLDWDSQYRGNLWNLWMVL